MSEVVLASNEVSWDAHRDLYHFTENSYIITGEHLLESIVTFTGDLNKLHIALTWTDIIKLAAWHCCEQSLKMLNDLRGRIQDFGVVAGFSLR